MHELSIALGIIDAATEESQRQGDVSVIAVHLKLGPLSGVVKEALLSAYELAREGSALENAELIIKDVPIVVFCSSCNIETTLASMQDFSCRECGRPTGEVVSGRELEIVALEIESCSSKASLD